MLGGNGKAAPGLGRGAGDESERDNDDEAADGEARPGTARSSARALERGRFSVQHGPGVVVRPGMLPDRHPGGRRRACAHRRSNRPEDEGRASAGAPRLPKELRRKPVHRHTAHTTNLPLHIPLSGPGTESTDGTRSHTGGKGSPDRRQRVMARKGERCETNGPPSPFAGKPNSEGRESAGSTTGSIASAWRWRHLEATGAPFTTWKPSPTGGPSIAVAGCADAVLNRTPAFALARIAGFGRRGRSDVSAIPRCAWITGRLSSPLATGTTATRLGRLGKLGSATARGRGGRDTSYSRSLMYALPSRT